MKLDNLDPYKPYSRHGGNKELTKSHFTDA